MPLPHDIFPRVELPEPAPIVILAKRTNMNTDLLKTLASKIKTGRELMGSKWQNSEAEWIALQTISACALNLEDKGEALSWLSRSCLTGRDQAGTNNAHGLGLLISDGSLVQEQYTEGTLKAPEGTAEEDGNPLILRVTDKLLHYAMSEFGA